MNSLEKLIDPTKLTGNLVGNFQAAVNDLSKSVNSELTTQATSLTGEISQKLTSGLSSLTGGLTDKISSASKLVGAVTNPAGLLGKLAGNATGAFSQVQSLLDSVGNMSGQIKAPVLASNTIDTSAITAKIGKLLGDSRIPPPVFEEFASDIKSNSYQEAQSEALSKVGEIESKIELLKIKLSGILSNDAQSMLKIKDFNKQIAALNSELVTSQQAYERVITGKNNSA
jgi:uncharacterized small protein (DUF1192 family)